MIAVAVVLGFVVVYIVVKTAGGKPAITYADVTTSVPGTSTGATVNAAVLPSETVIPDQIPALPASAVDTTGREWYADVRRHPMTVDNSGRQFVQLRKY